MHRLAARVPRAVAVAALAWAAVARAAPAPERALPAYVPGGVADLAGTIVLVHTQEGGVEAVDAASGETRWRSAPPARALLVARGTAYVLEEPGPRALRVAAREAAGGRPIASWPLDAVEPPPWAGLGPPRGGREDVRVSVSARLAGAVLEIEYDARRTLITGTGPRPDGEAHAVARLDTLTGRVAVERDARLDEAPLSVPGPPAPAPRLARFHARRPDAALVFGGPPPDVEGALATPEGLVGFVRAPGRVIVHRWRDGPGAPAGRARTFEIAAESDAIWVTLDRRHVALRRAREQRTVDVYALDAGAKLATVSGAVDLSVVGGRLLFTSLGPRGELVLSALDPRSGREPWRRVLRGPPGPRGDPIP